MSIEITDSLTRKNQRISLWIAVLSSFFTPFLGSSLNIALPSIGKEFQMSAVSLSWVATAYLMAAGMALLPFGKLADILGRKKIFWRGVLLATSTCILAPFSPSGHILIVLRFLEGIGGAMIFSTGVSIMISLYPPRDRGKVLGITVASVYSGLSMGPVLGGLLTHQFGWRYIFSINIILGIIIIFLTRKLVGEWRESQDESFDKIGNMIYSLSLPLIIYGFSKITHPLGMILTLSGLIGMIGFVYYETQISNPLLELRLFKNLVFAFSNLAALINYSATFAAGFLLSLYLQYIKGLSPQNAGLILLSQPVLMAIVSPIAGRLSDHHEPRIVSSIGMGLCTLGLIFFCFLNFQTPLFNIILGLLFLGLGFGLFSSPNSNAVMGSVNKEQYGLASGILGTMRISGQIFSMGIATLFFALYLGIHPITPANYPLLLSATKSSFLFFAILCFLGIFSSLARGKLHD